MPVLHPAQPDYRSGVVDIMSAHVIVQNIDRIVTRKDYAPFGRNTLLVTSFFRTIQGEGPFAGYPAIFLRLAGCNFGDKKDHCSWCDTSFQFGRGRHFDVHVLIEQLVSIPGYCPTDILVVTGGEPTLQHALLDLLAAVSLRKQFAQVQIETNGTQAGFFAAMAELPKHVWPVVVISPKASAKSRQYPRVSDTVLRSAHALKFVVEAEASSCQSGLPQWAFDARDEHGLTLYVSPMTVYARSYDGEVSSIWEDGLIDRDATARNYAYAARYAMQHHILLSLQTHLFVGIA
jgi:7-carboxy-7-deazaguanine synthase